MGIEFKGDFSANSMVSVPPPKASDLESDGSKSDAKANVDGQEVSDDIFDEEQFADGRSQPKQSFSSQIADAVKGAFGKGIGGASMVVSTVASTAASFLHIPVAVANVGMSVLMAGAIGTGVVAVDSYANDLSPALWVVDDCSERVANAKEADTDTVSETSDMEKNARIIYSALKGVWGYDDAHIAAVLSNCQAEGGIDPTSVEAYYLTCSDRYQYCEHKKAAIEDIDNYTRNVVWPAYKGGLNYSGYECSDGIARCGVGLVGRTGEGCKTLLEDADKLGQEWCNMNFQLAWEMVTYQDDWDGFKGQSGDSTSLAVYFCNNYERNPSHAADHSENASYWESEIASWTVDQSVVTSIENYMAAMGTTATKKEVAAQTSKCGECASSATEEQYDNSSMAAAAVSYAYPTEAGGIGNNGTELYQKVHNAVLPGDSLYMSCDRSVACAVRWSGKDDDFPAGSTTNQADHFASTSDKWKNVTSDIKSMSDLQPGDIFCTVTNGHILMYVGNELVKQIHGDEGGNANFVSGSLGERSPGCGHYEITSYGSSVLISSDSRPYYIWRCISTDTSSKYTNAVAGETISTTTASSSGKSSGSESCKKKAAATGSGAAFAAVMFSYTQLGDYMSSNQLHYGGTDLYQLVYTKVLGDKWPVLASGIYENSCNSPVSAAIIWSGTDLDYEFTATDQYNYLHSGQTKWEQVGSATSVKDAQSKGIQLEPGDVFIIEDGSADHVFMYVGTETVEACWDYLMSHDNSTGGRNASGSYVGSIGSVTPKSGSCVVEAHSNSAEGSPSTQSQESDWSNSPAGIWTDTDIADMWTYEIWRCVKPDNSTQYLDAASSLGVTLKQK